MAVLADGRRKPCYLSLVKHEPTPEYAYVPALSAFVSKRCFFIFFFFWPSLFPKPLAWTRHLPFLTGG